MLALSFVFIACSSDPDDDKNGTVIDPEPIPACEHEYGAWTVTTPAGCITFSEETQTCSKCGVKQTRKGTVTLGHDWDNYVSNGDGTETRTCKRTGCNASHTRTTGTNACVECGETDCEGECRFIVDLSTLPFVKNTVPLAEQWADLLIRFPSYDVDFTKFSRITVKAKYYDINGNEIHQSNNKVMVTLIYDPAGDLRGPSHGPGPNTPLKEFNVGGISGLIDKNPGAPLSLTQAPGAILFQNSNINVK